MSNDKSASVYKSSPPGRTPGLSDRWRRLSDEVPQKSRYRQAPQSRLHGTDDLTSANVPDATSATRLRAGRLFPAFAAILIPASVLSKKSARLSRSDSASSSPSI